DDIMWSWWNYPIISNKSIYNNQIHFSYTDKTGATGILNYDISTQEYKKVSIKEKILDIDDHNAGAVITLNNGSLITTFSESHSRSNNFFAYKSTELDGTQNWRKVYEKRMLGGTTYSQILYINDILYIFFRLSLPSSSFSWVMIKSTDKGERWSEPKTIIYSHGERWYHLLTAV